MQADTLTALFKERTQQFPQDTALLVKRNSVYAAVRWSEVAERVYAIAAGLLTAGVQPGDRVGILSENRLEWIEAVEEDVRAQLAGSFLADAPILRVSAATGKGMDALRRALLSSVSRTEPRNAALPFRLPIDRVFTRPGFGTVVTGTLVAGTLRTGDAVEIVPQKISTRVRGLQIHGQKVTEAEAGSRVAVNIAGVETEAVERGAQLVAPNSLAPTQTFDAVLRLLPHLSRPLKDRARVRVYLGTSEILGRMRLLDERSELESEGRAYVQFRAETEFACARGDRFVVRSYSPMTTIGGGFVLDSAPARHRKADPSVLAALEAKERGTPEDLVETALQRLPTGLLRKELPAAAGLTSADAETALQTLLQTGKAVALPGDRILHAAILAALTDRARATLEAYHAQFPLRAGMPKEELRATLEPQKQRDSLKSGSFAALLAYWEAQHLLVVEGITARLAAFQVQLNERQQSLLQRIEEVYKTYDIAPPTLAEVCVQVKAPPDAVNALLRVGVERGRFLRVQDGIYYHTDTITRLQALVRDYIAVHGSITVAAFRDLTESNRKFALLALEFFDQIRFTRRHGDERVLTTV